MLSFRPCISIVLYFRHCNLIGCSFSQRGVLFVNTQFSSAVFGFIVHVAIITL